MPSTTALLVIDLQNGVLPGCHDAAAVVRRTATLVAKARAAVVPVIWVQDHQDWEIGSDLWQMPEQLAATANEPIVNKQYRDSFEETDLAGILKDLGTKHLIVAGAQSDYCVRTTTQAAAVRGFDVTLVSDAHTTTDISVGGEHLTGAQIIAHTNHYLAGLRYKGQHFAATPHTEITF